MTLLAGFFKHETAPRFRVKSEFRSSFLTGFRAMPYTGGGSCLLSEGLILTCSRWIDGKSPRGFFTPEDLSSFNSRWVSEAEYNHPHYLGPSIIIDEYQLGEFCERVDDLEQQRPNVCK